MNICKYITYAEAIKSDKATKLKLDNTPGPAHLENMKLVGEKCFDPLREWYGKPITVNSFYRSPAVNKAVNGSKTSDHMNGSSIDLTAGSVTENLKLFTWMKANLKFDQLIWENGGAWIHISFKSTGNRNQILNLKQKVA
jgi:zinc D-Ala-D-Ala carboxypeptidase